MKAPDKIYVKEFDEGISHLLSSEKTPKTTEIARHEYIRKDALLEWLKEQRDEHSFEVRKAYQRTIEKIESL